MLLSLQGAENMILWPQGLMNTRPYPIHDVVKNVYKEGK
jgi:hypothetical protein